MSLCIHVVIYIGILCLISTAKYYFMNQLCCLVDITNFHCYTVFCFINTPSFFTILVFVGIWAVSEFWVIRMILWIFWSLVLLNIWRHGLNYFSRCTMYICIYTYICLISDLQCCVCSANSKYWQKGFSTDYKNVYSEQQSTRGIVIIHSNQHLILFSYFY